MSKTKHTEKKNDGVYFHSLNTLVDRLFEVATKQQWTWERIADESGLSRYTIYNLGMGITRYPQFRTVELLAWSLGGTLSYSKQRTKGTASSTKQRRWILKFFEKETKKPSRKLKIA
jgi:hypothetical protein